jgi:alanyl-tRNA synthetase
MHLNEIRSLFLSFFESKGHKILPSSPLVPINDPSLMFTNSGMVQFKDIFLGNQQPQHLRATTSQKCVRAGGKHNDLDNVGYTTRHHTFFEMLGNFSFGDYFKEEAIEFAWEFLTKVLKINQDKLYVTVYHTDEFAFSTWKKVAGLHDNRIIRINTNDNFWSMGPTGPCGPCSEIFFDHGEQYAGGLPGSDNDGDRYIEIWNLVFMQNEQFEDGTMAILPKPSIDTGIGLERLTAVMQGINDNFQIDIFHKLIKASQELSGNRDNITAHKVISDHLRAMSFLIADGIMPSNDGRGYVLRRIMRRAMRYVQNIGYKEPFLHKLVPTLSEVMGVGYPELQKAEAVIRSVIYNEEAKFGFTLERGLKILNDEISLVNNNILPGAIAFKLYDTYGFPLDLTKDILRQHSIEVEDEGFNHAMNEQKTRARAAWGGSSSNSQDKIWFDIADKVGSTEFFGYSCNEMTGIVLAIIVDGQVVDKINQEEEGILVLNRTPFYGESGGQVGDSGEFRNGNKVICKANNTIIYPGRVFGHHVVCKESIVVGDILNGVVDTMRRDRIRCNHSATHLLHKVLRDNFGEHITQKGSLVNEYKLRFDFAHNTPLDRGQIRLIERQVNNMIRENKQVDVKIMAYDEAVDQGAMALFGEKYSDEVRVIFMCDSIELCGGTHVSATGDIGLFKIVSESAIASGVRRIEAVTAETALEYYNSKYDIVHLLGTAIKCSDDQIIGKVIGLIEEKKLLTKQLHEIQISELVKGFKIKDGIAIQETDNLEINTMRSAVIAAKIADAIVVLLSKTSNTQSLVLSTPKGSKPDAKLLYQVICDRFGGKGGGSLELIQIGGIPLSVKLSDIYGLISEQI